MIGERGLILAASITSAVKPSMIPPVRAPFWLLSTLNMVTPMSLILVLDDGILKPGIIRVRNCEDAPVPPRVTVAYVPVIVHKVTVKVELP
jgi:hypothetical protein